MNENADREINTMKILLKNIEESKGEEMKKYRESIMKENEKIQIIKENLYMEYEDMRGKSVQVYQMYIDLTKTHDELIKQNQKHISEIVQLKELLSKTEHK
jgi:predicted GTPase